MGCAADADAEDTEAEATGTDEAASRSRDLCWVDQLDLCRRANVSCPTSPSDHFFVVGGANANGVCTGVQTHLTSRKAKGKASSACAVLGQSAPYQANGKVMMDWTLANQPASRLCVFSTLAYPQ